MKKKRRIWYPRCKFTHKVRYPSQHIAQATMVKFIASGKPDPTIHEYECLRCNGWHLGTNDTSLARSFGETGDVKRIRD